MKIAVLGTGMVGDTIGSKLIELGHTVKMGSRTAINEKAVAFVAKHPSGKAEAGTFADAVAYGELIFNCTLGVETINILKTANKDLDGKVLIDVSNSLDFSKGMPPQLSVCNSNSLGEEIQKTFPKLKVVKSLNTMWCGIMVNPMLIGGGDHHVFMSGNDAEAKNQVSEILKSFGWLEKNIMDLGDISTARGTEMMMAIWLRIYGATKNGAFNFKIIS
jgi:predicted dinucleotide-binding enzyme